MNSLSRHPNPATAAPSHVPQPPTEPESETKMISVFCDLCDESMHATRANLLRYGWGIYGRDCFCPFHEGAV